MSPSTLNGKEVAKWNATRHGINSPAPVVPALESVEGWQAHGEGVLESLQPKGPLETVLAERVALLLWRLHRVTRFETGAITTAQETIEDDIHQRERLVGSLMQSPYESTHPADIRFEAKHYKQVERTLKRFPSLESEKTLNGRDASSVVWSVLMEAKKWTEEEVDEEAIDLPGVPEDTFIEELPAMKVADLRGCIEAIATHVGTDADKLLEAATAEAGYKARGAAIKKEEVEQEITRKQRERTLPDDDTLQKVARYEAHLARQLYHALHELEALQAKRRGGKAPLARLDVHGS